jgi:hypothetical protein
LVAFFNLFLCLFLLSSIYSFSILSFAFFVSLVSLFLSSLY